MKKAENTVQCPSCGASFESSLPACPYCGTMYLPGAKKDYMGKLSGIRTDLGTLPDEMGHTLKKEMSVQTRRVVRIVIAVLAVAAVIFLIVQIRQGNRERAYEKEYAWQRENFAKWDTLYENRDAEALYEAFCAARDEDHEVYNYKHYDFIRTYEEILFLADTIEAVRSGYTEDETDLLYCTVNLEGMDERPELTDADLAQLSEMAAPHLAEAKEMLTVPDSVFDTLESLREKQGGYVYYTQCEDALKKGGDV